MLTAHVWHAHRSFQLQAQSFAVLLDPACTRVMRKYGQENAVAFSEIKGAVIVSLYPSLVRAPCLSSGSFVAWPHHHTDSTTDVHDFLHPTDVCSVRRH